jgi:isocitrate/isopropylmalate dehydrogenase
VKTGPMMPEDGTDQLRPFDAVFLGAVGYPGVPDHVSQWGGLIPERRHLTNTSICGRCASSPGSVRP